MIVTQMKMIFIICKEDCIMEGKQMRIWVVTTKDELIMIAKARTKAEAEHKANLYHNEVYGEGRDDFKAKPIEDYFGNDYDIAIIKGYDARIIRGYEIR